MFNNREFRVRVANTKKEAENSTPEESKVLNPETVKLIAERGKDVVKYIAVTAVGVYATIKVIDTLSQIAVKKTKSADDQ